MKFSTSKIELQKGLQKLSKATPIRSTLPILSCVLIKVNSKQTILRATDLEITIQTELACSYEEEGEAALPLKTLLEMYLSSSFLNSKNGLIILMPCFKFVV